MIQGYATFFKKKALGSTKSQTQVGVVNFVLFAGFVSGQYGANTTEPRKVHNVVMELQCGQATFAETIAHEDWLPMPTIKIFLVVKSTSKVVGSQKGLGNLSQLAGKTSKVQAKETVEMKTDDPNVNDADVVTNTTVGMVCLTGAIAIDQQQ